jgi:1,4-dihydroxy-2-naphthoate octaprenyltransferase
MALTFSWSALWASVALGFLVAGILHANNIRDIETDALHGKHTLATILGRAGAIRELIALDVLAYSTALIAILARSLPWTALVVAITLPRALDQIRIVRREIEARKLNLALMRSVQLHMEFGILMIIAFVTAAIFKW